MDLIYITGVISLIIQILTGIIDFYVLQLNIPSEIKLLSDLLLVEFIVQIIEGTFYIWMVLNFSKIKNITPHRYMDWFFTTPVMLMTYSIYLLYLKNSEENEKNKNLRMIDLVKKHWKVLLPIIALNCLMLLFGYLGEIKVISMFKATILGFIPFFIYFYMIYNNFAKDFKTGRNTFIIFFGLWTIYGIASFFPYNLKNISYNILDLFAKNFFGIFLAFLIMYELKKYNDNQNKKEIE